MARVVLGACAVARSEDGRKCADEKDANRRHTGAYYSDVDLDVRPNRRGVVIPSRIVRLREGYERLKTDNRDDSNTNLISKVQSYAQCYNLQ